jgi:hypothetical protein
MTAERRRKAANAMREIAAISSNVSAYLDSGKKDNDEYYNAGVERLKRYVKELPESLSDSESPEHPKL